MRITRTRTTRSRGRSQLRTSGGIALPDVSFALASAVSGVQDGVADDFTEADFGTPKAALAMMFSTAALGSIQANGSGSLGFSDMTNQGCTAWYSDDAVASTDCQSMKRSGQALTTLTADSSASLGEATIGAITDGCRYTYGKSDDTIDFILANLMFGGAACSAQVGNITDAITDDGTLAVTTSFKPDVLIFTCSDIAASTSVASPATVSFGFCDASLNQGGLLYREFHGQTPSLTNNPVFSNRVLASRISPNNLAVEVTAIGDTSFTLTGRNAGGASFTPDISWLALKLEASTDAKVGTHELPNTTGVKTIAGVGFKPRLVLQLDGGAGTYASDPIGTGDGLIGLSLLLAGNQISGGTASAHAVEPSDTINGMKNVAIWYPGFGGSETLYEGSAFTPRPDGYSINYGKASASTHKGLYLAFR